MVVLFNIYATDFKHQKKIPKWNKFVNFSKPVLIIFSLLFLIGKVFRFNREVYHSVIFIFGVFSIIIGLINTFIIYKKIKTKIATYFLIGSILYLVLAGISFYITVMVNLNKLQFSSKFIPIIFMEIGDLIELLMFSQIIAFKINRDRFAKEKLEKSYIKKVLEIEFLHKKIATILNEKQITSPKQITLNELNAVSKNQLSIREFEILNLISLGHNNKQIADGLYISINTVKYHLKNTYEKLNVKNRIQASQFLTSTNK